MLELQRFLIKNKAASPKTVDIFDPDTQEKVGLAREESGLLVRWLCGVIGKRFLSTKVEARETEDESLVFTIRGPAHWLRRRIEVFDAEERLVGFCESPLFSRSRVLRLYDGQSELFAEVRGDWRRHHYAFVSPDIQELGVVTRDWPGPGKELLTSAGDYVLSIQNELADQPLAKMLLLATALALGTVYDAENR